MAGSSRLGAAVGLLIVMPLLAAPARGREVRVPIELDHEFLRQGFVHKVYNAPNETAPVWDDGSGCNFLTLSSPKVDHRNGRLRVVSGGRARVGTALGSQCLVALDWDGFLEVLEEPVVDPTVPVVSFRVVDSNIYDKNWKKSLVTGVLWDWVKQYVHPRLESVNVDLYGALVSLREVLPLFLPGRDAERVERLIASLALADVRVADSGLSAIVRFDTGEAAQAPRTPVAEPTLSEEEMKRWSAALDRWDAFLTFVIKNSASEASTSELRAALFDVLMDARYELAEALREPTAADRDPVRRLFVDAWVKLAPVLRNLHAGLPAEAALRYMSFIAAGDALRGLDELGPEVGVEISSDGLRRLARIVAPDTVEDPVAYDLAIDLELRRLFGFGDPIEPPADNPNVDLNGSWLPALWRWARGFGPDAAIASIEFDGAQLARLNGWVPERGEIESYLPIVRALLHHTTDRMLSDHHVPSEFEALYRNLVLATAWQETCWRQFVKEGGRIKPIRSAVGSVGLMQVNQKVWRGFYDINGLQKDIGYNARAGSEILRHYLVDYAIARREHIETGNADNLARATYSVYNGGPSHLTRYRKPKTKKALRAIDEAFWEKYKVVKGGDELGVLACYAAGASSGPQVALR